jgi:hypothetical protein
MNFIECSGSPLQMGREYGEQAKNEIQRNIELFGRSWNINECGESIAKIKHVIKKYLPEVYSELIGIAEGANADIRYILLMNHVDTFGNDVERCLQLFLEILLTVQLLRKIMMLRCMKIIRLLLENVFQKKAFHLFRLLMPDGLADLTV